MNDPESLPSVTDAFLDRIVDGWLTPTQFREAIDRLEREPGGWKRCALAFLEAQCWRESFWSMEDTSVASPGRIAAAARPTTAPASRSRARWSQIAAAAGIAAISFVLGWRIHPDRTPLTGPTPSSLTTVGHAPTADVPRTKDLPVPIEAAIGSIRDGDPSRQPARPILTVGRLRLGPDRGAPAVPILSGPGIDKQWVSDQPPPITDHQTSLLEQHGYQVDRHRRLITATLRDGRRVTVPVDHFQVLFTGIEPL
jgi:hypothetical protein